MNVKKGFNNLLHEIVNATTLAHFAAQLPLILATDVSHYGVEAVILHRYPDGSERPIAHASKTLTSVSVNRCHSMTLTYVHCITYVYIYTYFFSFCCKDIVLLVIMRSR